MSWLEDISEAINYIEKHLTDELTADDVAKRVNLSPFYFQKGFSVMCGITVSEYIRNRRLSLAGRDLQQNGSKVIDIALMYGYDSPDSFTKAFTRFHGITPAQAKNGEGEIRNFLPLKIHISMRGGFEMESRIVKKPQFTVLASTKIIRGEDGYTECPKFWTEHFRSGDGQYISGMYGICMEQATPGTFKYAIADDYAPDTTDKSPRFADEKPSHIADEKSAHIADEMSSHIADEMSSHIADEMSSRFADEKSSHISDEKSAHIADGKPTHIADEKSSHFADEKSSRFADGIPSRFEIITIPENTWAIFPCKGPLPEALQKVNDEIFKEWLPGNPDYEPAGMYNIEYYTDPADYPAGNRDENYYCEIWMPVKAKQE